MLGELITYAPAMELHYATIWESIADEIPDATAVVHGTTVRTWAEYDERSARIAAAYASAGLGRKIEMPFRPMGVSKPIDLWKNPALAQSFL